MDTAVRPAGSRVRGRRRVRRPALLVAVAPDHDSRAGAVARGRPDRRRRLRGRRAALTRRGRDQPALRAVRRHGRPPCRHGGARAPVPHVGLPRAAHAADRDPRSRRCDPRRADRGPGADQRVAGRRLHGGDAAGAARRRRARPRQAAGAPVHRAGRRGRHVPARRARVRRVRRRGAAPGDRLQACSRKATRRRSSRMATGCCR